LNLLYVTYTFRFQYN